MNLALSVVSIVVVVVIIGSSVLINFSDILKKFKHYNYKNIFKDIFYFIFSIPKLMEYNLSAPKRKKIISYSLGAIFLIIQLFFSYAAVIQQFNSWFNAQIILLTLLTFIAMVSIFGVAISFMFKIFSFAFDAVSQLKVHERMKVIDPIFLFTMPLVIIFLYHMPNYLYERSWLALGLLIPLYLGHINIFRSMVLTANNPELIIVSENKSHNHNKYRVAFTWCLILFISTYIESLLTESFENKPEDPFTVLLSTYKTFTTLDIPAKDSTIAQIQSLITSSSGIFFFVIFITTVLSTEIIKKKNRSAK